MEDEGCGIVIIIIAAIAAVICILSALFSAISLFYCSFFRFLISANVPIGLLVVVVALVGVAIGNYRTFASVNRKTTALLSSIGIIALAFALGYLAFQGVASKHKAAGQVAAQAAQAARAMDRSRVEQGITGEWVGTFGSHADARLTITIKATNYGAVLLSGGYREILDGELLQDNRLRLTGTKATRVGSSASSTYSLDTIQLGLRADGGSITGQYGDTAGHSGTVEMKKRLSKYGKGEKRPSSADERGNEERHSMVADSSATSETSDSLVTSRQSPGNKTSERMIGSAASAPLMDHWSTATECLAAETAPFYYPTLVKQRPLANNEIVNGHPTGGCFEMDLPDRMGGRGFVRIEKGREFVFDRTTGAVLRLAVSNNAVYSWKPFPMEDFGSALKSRVAETPDPNAAPAPAPQPQPEPQTESPVPTTSAKPVAPAGSTIQVTIQTKSRYNTFQFLVDRQVVWDSSRDTGFNPFRSFQLQPGPHALDLRVWMPNDPRPLGSAHWDLIAISGREHMLNCYVTIFGNIKSQWIVP